MSGTSYLKLVSGNRLSSYLGLKMDEGYDYTFPGVQERGYAYIEIPVKELVNVSTGEVGEKASRNQHIQIVPACTVNVKGSYRFEVHGNPNLWKYGIPQGVYYLEPREGEIRPSLYMSLRKDLDLSTVDDLGYAVRIYMRA